MRESLNKRLYKLFLVFTRNIPITLALFYGINTILCYHGIILPIIYYIGGTSLIFIAMLYLISYVFQFCQLFRIPLHYLVTVNMIGIIDKWIILPLSTLAMFRLIVILSGVALIAYVYYAFKNRNKPKVDYIKNLCDRYNGCCK